MRNPKWKCPVATQFYLVDCIGRGFFDKRKYGYERGTIPNESWAPLGFLVKGKMWQPRAKLRPKLKKIYKNYTKKNNGFTNKKISDLNIAVFVNVKCSFYEIKVDALLNESISEPQMRNSKVQVHFCYSVLFTGLQGSWSPW